MKRTAVILLTLCITLSLCACGNSTGVKAVQTLVEQEYSLAFRNDDIVYYYVTSAISELGAEGKVDELAYKWLGSAAVDFYKEAGALAKLQPPEPREFIVGVDINAFPMSYVANGEYWGFDVELAMAVAEKLGWTLNIQQIEKENVYIELSSGNIDCAWGGIALDPEEISAGKYTQYGPYIHNDIIIAARNGSSVWNRLMLSGKNMTMNATPEAMAALNSDEGLTKRLGQISRLVGGTTECFQYLYSGKCDAVLTDSTALMYFNCH